ncbi:MAG: Dabb family protein [Bacteroidota bacterium]
MKKQHILPFTFITLFAFSIVSCTNGGGTETTTGAAVTAPKDVLKHVVAFTFKDSLTTERKVQAVADFVALKNQVPGILSFEGGEDVSVEGLTKGFTHCFIVTFESLEARDVYIPHPAHLELVDKNKPLMKDLIVLDVWAKE